MERTRRERTKERRTEHRAGLAGRMVGSLLPVREAAQVLAVSRQRVHQLIGAGVLDAAQPGREWLVSAGSVQDLLDRRRTRRPRMRRQGGRA